MQRLSETNQGPTILITISNFCFVMADACVQQLELDEMSSGEILFIRMVSRSSFGPPRGAGLTGR
jgi:hypothetical protein